MNRLYPQQKGYNLFHFDRYHSGPDRHKCPGLLGRVWVSPAFRYLPCNLWKTTDNSERDRSTQDSGHVFMVTWRREWGLLGRAPAAKLIWEKKRGVDPVTFNSEINQINSVIALHLPFIYQCYKQKKFIRFLINMFDNL